ncbi:Uu.00g012760.m01.CDS01 [Anthostomella pinea]|uniref:Uu.00g012760.m01.CDS01 n=1 Tax=Anthostomella pinea TaxID=933095 RepID=A0AAI8YMX7_9PEZI|nr:Uu.00g012760.m01.CDS01 [Anthostomella pinea]
MLDGHGRENYTLLVNAHELYLQGYLDQERARTDGTFAQAVADGVSRMPAAMSLFIGNYNEERTWLYSDADSFTQAMGTPTRLTNYMVQPMDWEEADENGLSYQPFVEVVGQVTSAICKTGVMLTDIDYRIAPVGDVSHYCGDLQDINDLSIAMRQLKKFTFRPSPLRSRSPNFSSWDIFQWEHLRCFLEAFIDNNSIESIDINLQFFWQGATQVPPGSSPGSLLLTRKWPRLRKFFFEGPLHLEELRRFLAGVQQRVTLQLSRVSVLSGLWVDVLDTMRTYNQHLRRFSKITSPRGADSRLFRMSEFLNSFTVTTVQAPSIFTEFCPPTISGNRAGKRKLQVALEGVGRLPTAYDADMEGLMVTAVSEPNH